MNFPFDIEIRRKRVKYLRLRILSNGKVLLTLPWYVPESRGLRFVREKTEWIEKALRRKEEGKLNEFLFLGKNYELVLSENMWKKEISFEGDTVRIGAQTKEEARKYFQEYLKKTARKILTEEMEKLSDKYGLPYRRLSFRSQKTRWGSCSPRKDISLNIALVRLTADLREYVLIHELCHTKEMNHSKRFWDLVGTHYPKYKEAKRELKKYGLTLS